MSKRTMRGRRWKRLRLRAFEASRWRCVKCGKAARLEAHHRIPLEEGGAGMSLANVEPLCRRCHIEAHRRAVRDNPPGRRKWAELADAEI